MRELNKMVFVSAMGALSLGSMTASAADIELPDTLAWSAYPTGSTGYSQAVGIGSVLQNNYGVNLRVLPGRNDVSRLYPLRNGRVDFAASGPEVTYAQEGMYDFSSRDWGPQSVRIMLWNISDGCSFTFAAAADAGIDTVADLRGKRLTYVQGAPSLNNGSAALLSYANLTWDDVERVEVSGYPGSVEAVIENRADAVGGSCNAPPFLRIESSPRGLKLVTFPHDDEEAVQRVRSDLPTLVPHVAVQGVTIDPAEGIEVFTSAYPTLITMADQEEALVYNMTKAMVEHYDDYKDSAPGAEGWALDRQELDTALVPFHDGAVRYFEEIGVWTEAAETNQQLNLKRQEVIQAEWQVFIPDAPSDEDEFRRAWEEARTGVLEANGLRLIPERF